MLTAVRRKWQRFWLHRRLVGAWQALRFEVTSSLRHRLVTLRPPGFRHPLRLRRASSDLMTFHQIYLERELDVYLPERPRLIVDGGANAGFSAAFYAQRYPDARVLAVEPAADNFARLVDNCRPYPNVTPVQGGLWPRRARLRVVDVGLGDWGFQVEEVDGPAPDGVEGWPADELMDRAGFDRIDLLKLDIEGAERHLFADPGAPWLSRVDAVVIELHGPEAAAAVRAALSPAAFSEGQRGEKVSFVRRPAKNSAGPRGEPAALPLP
jgi:FkbM family methyltransferase